MYLRLTTCTTKNNNPGAKCGKRGGIGERKGGRDEGKKTNIQAGCLPFERRERIEKEHGPRLGSLATS